MSFNKRVTKLRNQKNITQRELSRQTGIHYTMLNKYEHGQGEPSADNIRILAKYFGVSTDYLLFDESDSVASSKIIDPELLEQFKRISRLNDDTKDAVKCILDAVIVKSEIGNIVNKK